MDSKKDRVHYAPRLTWKPLVPVRWRSGSDTYGVAVTRRWRIYLFGLLPILSLPRRAH